MRGDARLRVALLALALLAGACGRKSGLAGGGHSPLYTGHEPKRKVQLTLPSRQQAGFVQVEREIYATASAVNQGKQLLQALLDGPLAGENGAAPCFGPQATYLELYLDNRGMAVVDLPKATVDGLPGGTSAEVAALYCVIRTLNQNLQVARVQILIDGQVPESLRGHMDLQDPLSLGDL